MSLDPTYAEASSSVLFVRAFTTTTGIPASVRAFSAGALPSASAGCRIAADTLELIRSFIVVRASVPHRRKRVPFGIYSRHYFRQQHHPSRKERIARGSGNSVAELNQLLKNFEQMQKMMKKMAGGKMPSMPQGASLVHTLHSLRRGYSRLRLRILRRRFFWQPLQTMD